jgi:hypothetical protein
MIRTFVRIYRNLQNHNTCTCYHNNAPVSCNSGLHNKDKSSTWIGTGDRGGNAQFFYTFRLSSHCGTKVGPTRTSGNLNWDFTTDYPRGAGPLPGIRKSPQFPGIGSRGNNWLLHTLKQYANIHKELSENCIIYVIILNKWDFLTNGIFDV